MSFSSRLSQINSDTNTTNAQNIRVRTARRLHIESSIDAATPNMTVSNHSDSSASNLMSVSESLSPEVDSQLGNSNSPNPLIGEKVDHSSNTTTIDDHVAQSSIGNHPEEGTYLTHQDVNLEIIEPINKSQEPTLDSNNDPKLKNRLEDEKLVRVIEQSRHKRPQKNIDATADQKNKTEYNGTGLEKNLHLNGPYVRVYEKSKAYESDQVIQSVESLKYTSIIDVSSHRENRWKRDYPTIIKTPAHITKVTFDVPSGSDKSSSPITLHRPKNGRSAPRYGASTASKSTYNSLAQSVSVTSNASVSETYLVTNASQPIIPFLTMSNSLQLYLKLQVFELSEITTAWIPGSFTLQKPPFVPQPKAAPFSFIDIFEMISGQSSPRNNETTSCPLLYSPCYFLLSNKFIYIFTPRFFLEHLKTPLNDEQTSYYDPSRILRCKYKLPLTSTVRIDVGLRRQYLSFHFKHESEPKKIALLSLVFQTRSKQATTLIIDSITSMMHEQEEFNGSLIRINQDMEWCIKSLQRLLLCPGPKEISILSYGNVWTHPSPLNYELRNEEYDKGFKEGITKVDFDFIKTYLLCCFLRYIRPFHSSDSRSVEIQHVSLLGTEGYIYLFQERFDVWPPIIVPPEFNPAANVNTAIQNIISSTKTKGLLIDVIPQFQSLIGVGRIKDVFRIERWRSYRIDEGLAASSGAPFGDFKGLGRALQNGHIGFFNKHDAERVKQQGALNGFFWWIRIVFGASGVSEPASAPISTPKCVPASSDEMRVDYWWDLVFGSRESADEFVETIQKLRGHRNTGITFIFGDD